MSRYFSRPKAREPRGDSDGWYDALILNGLSVSDHEDADTGLVDVRGNPIKRAPNPMGFGKDREW